MTKWEHWWDGVTRERLQSFLSPSLVIPTLQLWLFSCCWESRPLHCSRLARGAGPQTEPSTQTLWGDSDSFLGVVGGPLVATFPPHDTEQKPAQMRTEAEKHSKSRAKDVNDSKAVPKARGGLKNPWLMQFSYERFDLMSPVVAPRHGAQISFAKDSQKQRVGLLLQTWRELNLGPSRHFSRTQN